MKRARCAADNDEFIKKHVETCDYRLQTAAAKHNKYGVLLAIPNIYGSDGINHRQRVFDELHATPYDGHRGVDTP